MQQNAVAEQGRVRTGERVKAGLEKSRLLYGRIGGRPFVEESKIEKIRELKPLCFVISYSLV